MKLNWNFLQNKKLSVGGGGGWGYGYFLDLYNMHLLTEWEGQKENIRLEVIAFKSSTVRSLHHDQEQNNNIFPFRSTQSKIF